MFAVEDSLHQGLFNDPDLKPTAETQMKFAIYNGIQP